MTRYIEDPVSEFIISDRLLAGKKNGAALRQLRVSLAPDKESTVVALRPEESVETV